MQDTLNVLKVISTTDSKVNTLNVSNGQLIFVKDTHRILLDIDNKRTAYEQITTINTEAERTNFLAPIDGFYFVMDTAILWRYSGEWIQITSQPANHIVQMDSLVSFPLIGNENLIYIDKSENATYRWDNEGLKYYCIGRDYKQVEIINGGSAI